MKNNLTAKASVDINATAAKAWDALTNPEIIKQYFFGTNTETDWKVGSPIKFKGEYNGQTYEDKGTILAMEPKKLIKYKYWSSMSGIEDKPENYVDITYELSGDDNKSTVSVTQENIPNEKMKEHSEANWKMVLDNMKNLLEK